MKKNNRSAKVIYNQTAESAAMVADTKQAMAITAKINRLTFDDADEVRVLFGQLIGKEVDASFLLLPPFYTASGKELVSVGMCSSTRIARCMTWVASPSRMM